MNRSIFSRAGFLFLKQGAKRSSGNSFQHKREHRARRLRFETVESRHLLAATITGFKAETVNSSGFSPGDIAMAGVFIDLYKDNGDGAFNPAVDTLADRQQTAANGSYTFANVADGHYFIQEEVPTGFTQSAGPPFYTVDVINSVVYNGTSQITVDSFSDPNPAASFFINALDPDPFFLQTNGSGIVGGQRDLVVDVLGASNPVSANGFVGTVAVNNGVFNLGTASGPGSEVEMQYDGADLDTAALSNANGLSTNLSANGNNGIRFDFNFLQVGSGTSMNLSVSLTSPSGTATAAGSIAENPGAFSIFVPYSSFATTGSFSFANVTSMQMNYNDSGVPGVDFEVNQIIATNATSSGFNFGNFPNPSSLAGHVYVDANNNGQLDVGEPPIGGVKITLVGVNDLGQTISEPATTAPDGTYKFSNLRPGTYAIAESQPINFIDGKDTIGTPGGTPANDLFTNIMLPAGFNGINNNFGELGLTPPFASKKSLLFPPQPVVLTAVYPTTTSAPLVAKAAPAAQPAAKKTTTKKTTAKPITSTVKAPIVSTPKKTTKKK